MSLPPIYLIEPYNAYAPKGRKKHWSEIVEEQALLERIMNEARLAEAKNSTLPQNSPPISAPTVGQASATGAGGLPFVAYFNPRNVVAFSLTAATGSAPTVIGYINNSSSDLQTQGVATYLWDFGDGTTSTDQNPTHNYTTTSSGNFAVTLKVTAVVNGATGSATQSLNMPAPTVTANYSLSSSISASTTTNITQSLTGSVGNVVNIAFVNTTTTNNAANSISYVWNFGSGSITSSLANPPLFSYTATGSYTVRLSATGSFNITSAQNRLSVLVIS